MKHTSRRYIGLLTTAVIGCTLLGARLNGQTNASLAWDPSPDVVAGYNIYLGSASGQYTSAIDVGTNTTITLNGLSTTLTNYFVVTAYNTARIESLPSNEATFRAPVVTNTPPPVTNPPPPIVITNPPPPITNPPPPIVITNNGPVTPQPLMISNAGQVQLSAAGASNGTCILQGSTDFATWKSVYTNQTGQPLAYTPGLRQGSWLYYRALWVAGTLNTSNINAAVSLKNFSPEIVGWVNINAGAGYTAIANPFETGNNTVASLLPTMPAGAVLNKYTTGLGYSSNVYAGGQWTTGAATLNPGEGGFLLNPTKKSVSITFAGNVLLNTVSNTIPTGYSLGSPLIPSPTALTTFPGNNGDQIQVYKNGQWVTYTCLVGHWFSTNARNGPLAFVPGCSYFIMKKATGMWVQSLKTPNL